MARLEIDLPDELCEELRLVADALGIPQLGEAAVVAIGEWTLRRKSELDDRDPNQKYMVNEALDELIDKNSKK